MSTNKMQVMENGERTMMFKQFLVESVRSDVQALSADAVEHIESDDFLTYVSIIADFIEENCHNSRKAAFMRNVSENGPEAARWYLGRGIESAAQTGFMPVDGIYDQDYYTAVQLHCVMPLHEVIRNVDGSLYPDAVAIKAFAEVTTQSMNNCFARQMCFGELYPTESLTPLLDLYPENVVLVFTIMPQNELMRPQIFAFPGTANNQIKYMPTQIKDALKRGNKKNDIIVIGNTNYGQDPLPISRASLLPSFWTQIFNWYGSRKLGAKDGLSMVNDLEDAGSSENLMAKFSQRQNNLDEET